MNLCPHWNQKYVTTLLHDKLIYKDECARCFHTAKDEGGLDLCLNTLVGHCKQHSLTHYENTGNPLVLNLKEVKKAAKAPEEVTKMAIDKPGGFSTGTDAYDTEVEVFCHACQKALDRTEP